ncbi:MULTISPECIES: DUF4350 domain-containing protein [unclassified Aureispira]|uniref:DUF4350 domain-containing protein n=1 Tax=unclassified Aureispira TaxID=2649989 RepID=UPI000697884E|nr:MULTISPECIES: DUF4350 domain-containing protein [unclassified Aureispira]WMX14834.1 DUF4350 domain-containing protein [Aureispira sp. CCB-E]
MNKFAPLLIGGIVLIGLIVYFASNQPGYYRWKHSYEVEGENPYDMKVLYDLLESQFELDVLEERVETKLSKKEEEAKGTSYLYIGQQAKYTEDEAWHLREYVRAGGDAFIITENINDSLAEILLYAEDCGGLSNWDGRNRTVTKEKVYASFKHPAINDHYYEFEYLYENYARAHYWHFIPSTAFCDSDESQSRYRAYPLASLGTFVDQEEKEYINFVRLKVGEGHFYFHTNPVMFSNLFLVDTAGIDYANNVLSHIKTNQLYWDRESAMRPKAKDAKRDDKPQIAAKSPLEYIFSQPALRWSWYLFISLGIIYVLFGAKRRQRKIPILETNRNTSLEFVETIGRLYFQQQDHKGIIKKQMHLFLAHLRQRYHLVTRDLDDKLIHRIAVRSKVDKEIINDIFVEYFRLRKILQQPYSKVDVDTLNNFYLLIDKFHQEVHKMQFVDKEVV